ncbi:nucleoside deoxyribosyltransferase [Gordonia phage Ayotoya]|uniref:Hydrolase n=7 Tax=Betterkatzvirus betterkatz TaxID=2560485 RepID=A0A2Z5HDX3_9CAUD|nr:hydrolase [Gordonia phage Nadeem]AZS11232.1 hydrolase [Gordonia phage WheatThin]QAX92560.1 hydrolase [Gordonia phage Mulch]QAY06521.1 hydrolase [Gordonia phage Parada]QPL13939.1 hydrolase [Gordonia phage NancyRae]QSL99929.1 nucleoside deoxyribosyltransferase [Gordonia phage Ayotoya]QXO14208.1 hydrolase [Gordonia phage Bock]URP21294.1 hydrolase [Gordonia phage Chop]UXL91342.1 hydrolase [Gordonia phage GrandSlam]
MSRRYYLAGPMSGHPGHNYPAFAEAADRLRNRGLIVVSPHELHGGDTSQPWTYYLRRDLRALLDCDWLVMLTGWESSTGATLEHRVATQLGMPCIEYADLLATLRGDNREPALRALLDARARVKAVRR